jgi:TPR repeat protein
MYILAAQYEKGDGVGQDLRLARYWYSAAAGAGDDAAPYKVKELDSRLARSPAQAQPSSAPPGPLVRERS